MIDISMRLRRYRVKNDLTQQDLAVKLGTCLATVNNWERGITKPSKRSMRDIEQLMKGV